VDRTYCRTCSSKLLTTRVVGVGGGTNHQQPHHPAVYINMGPIDDSTVPDDLAEYWKQRAPIQQWNVNMAASWTVAQPLYNDNDGRPVTATPSAMRSSGGCTCGSCQYDYRLEAPMEIQHCYCYLCRQLSGGMFMSWVPVKTRRQRFQWDMTSSSSRRSSADAPGGAAGAVASTAAATDESGRRTAGRHGRQGRAPRTYRYTDIGERHACTVCGGILTILYDHEDTEDEKRATIWLAAGGFDSIRFPFRIEPYLSRAVHICCRYKPKWYALPNDGLDKIPDAS
jgi:hypothetical protein